MSQDSKTFRRISTGVAACVMTFIFFNPPSTSRADSLTHDDCQLSSDCIFMTSVTQSCRHADSHAKDICPAVNKKYAAELAQIMCTTNVGCREEGHVSCEKNHCVVLPSPQ